MSDLSSIVPSGIVTLDLLHPRDRTEIGLRIELRSILSPEVKKVTRAIQNDRIALSKRGKSFTAEDETANSIKITVACMVGWTWQGDATFEGQQLEFNPDNAKKLARQDWVREQIDQELGDTGNFFQN